MSAVQALKNAELDLALKELTQEVRRSPDVAKHRIFLFQLLAVMGQWDRALTQLNVARDLDADALIMAQTYQEALHCEVLRSKIFHGDRAPLIFGEPEAWLALLLQALDLTTHGKHVEAERVRGEALEAAPTSPGRLTLRSAEAPSPDEPAPSLPFEWIADADSRLGPVLEAIVNGKYYWIPFGRIRRIDFEPPSDLRDVVWLPAHFAWANGGEAVGLIPTRYSGSESSSDDLLRMSRKTEWTELGSETYCGLGQRLLTTDGGEYPLMDLQRIDFDATPADATDISS